MKSRDSSSPSTKVSISDKPLADKALASIAAPAAPATARLLSRKTLASSSKAVPLKVERARDRESARPTPIHESSMTPWLCIPERERRSS